MPGAVKTNDEFLDSQLETLKLALVAATNQIRTIGRHRLGPISLQFPYAKADTFTLDGRLPSDLPEQIKQPIQDADATNTNFQRPEGGDFFRHIAGAYNALFEFYELTPVFSTLENKWNEFVPQIEHKWNSDAPHSSIYKKEENTSFEIGELDTKDLKTFIDLYIGARCCYLTIAYVLLHKPSDSVLHRIMELGWAEASG